MAKIRNFHQSANKIFYKTIPGYKIRNNNAHTFIQQR